ncbi:MAG: enoyl-CoA hydratase/isomerase family protein [Steroidobacteraceae bacterium]|nr:enoyl-CoA hydratase/isomerase family protein [Steroidobacteraceae bacterium]
MLAVTRDPRGIVTLTLDRPEARNALSGELVVRLTGAVAALAADHAVRAVVLTGAGEVFCAGADIGEMREAGSAPPAQNEADARRFAGMLEALERLPQPTVAVVNGAAMGGAVGLVACCDIALASDRARFALSEVRLGLVPAMISPYVIRAIGARQAHRWFLTGEAMDAATAKAAGLVHEVADGAALPALLQRITEALLAGGPRAQAEIKQLLRHVTGRSGAGDEALLYDTSRWIARVRAGDEAREGLTAFLERRKPGWIRGEP